MRSTSRLLGLLTLALAASFAASASASTIPTMSCDAMKPTAPKPAPKAPGKGGSKKKCITAVAPLDDGYVVAKGGKKKHAPPSES